MSDHEDRETVKGIKATAEEMLFDAISKPDRNLILLSTQVIKLSDITERLLKKVSVLSEAAKRPRDG